MNIDELKTKLGSALVGSPFLSVIIVDGQYRLVWHNQRFADEFNGGKMIESGTCFQAIGSEKVHADCPLQKSIKEGVCIKGFLDFGEKNFLFLTIPLDDRHAAKVHIFLPKAADGKMEEK